MNTALQRRAQLQAEVDARYTEMQALDSDANRETIEQELAALVAAGAWLEVDSSTESALKGAFHFVGGSHDFYDYYRRLGFTGYHDSIDTILPNFRLVIEVNDGALNLTIWHNTHHTTDETTWGADLAAAKAYLAKVGIPLKTAPLEWERDNHTRLATELQAAIAAIHS